MDALLEALKSSGAARPGPPVMHLRIARTRARRSASRAASSSRRVTSRLVAARRTAIERRRRMHCPSCDIAGEHVDGDAMIERARHRIETFVARAGARHCRFDPFAEPDSHCIAIIEMRHAARPY
ncbi:hypothetical protein [Burkholderia mayonis]|uniref:hypothetical protein n=1 Tax=Burkholderia mayonis TaxID=1385591 RepID=UPI00131F09B0|nr:hypothetical protein [Burkholderia mayonis]